jgi:two-component system chemotaxis response regulator CheB
MISPVQENAIRVLLCDDSAVIRGAVARMIEADGRACVVARAANGRQAIEALRRERADVAVLDIEMPEMDGLAALPELLRADPGLRVLMSSTLTTRGAEVTLRALRLGAADYVAKPTVAAIADDSFRRELLGKILALGSARRRHPTAAPARAALRPPPLSLAPAPAATRRPLLLALARSTGGPQALFTLLQALGRDVPVPVVVTQHMPPTFTTLLASQLDRIGALPCAEAREGEPLLPGRLYLAPGDRHLLVEAEGRHLHARLSDGPPENYCRPAADPMLRSAVTACDGRVLAIVLTGMGHDGLEGTRAVVGAGGMALAQDEASSVVWGMPGAVAEAGLCHRGDGPLAVARTRGMTPQGFAILADSLRRRSGLAIGPDKIYLLEARLAPLLRFHGLADLDALAARVATRADAELERCVAEAITTNESSFFRDGRPFEHVRTHALLRLHAARPPDAALRLWSAAASTGQEAYSLAMIIADLRPLIGSRTLEIVGTDIARPALARAREGLYSQFEVQRGLDDALLRRHFTREGEMWRVSAPLRAMTRFEERNLLGDLRALGRFDIVLCRNVLLYFDHDARRQVLSTISAQIAPDGFLYLGGAETMLGVSDDFLPLPRHSGAYMPSPLRNAAVTCASRVMPY